MDLSILKQAGVSQNEFGRLCGVSKIAVFKWSKGGGVNRFLQPKVVKLLATITQAVETGALPLPPGTPRADREKMIAAALVNQLRQA